MEFIKNLVAKVFLPKLAYSRIQENNQIKVEVGSEAPNGSVITLDGQKRDLLSYQRKDIPLVLNFGSYS